MFSAQERLAFTAASHEAFARIRRLGLPMLLESGSRTVEHAGTFGDVTDDANLKADRRMGEIIAESLQIQPFFRDELRRIRIEGEKDVITVNARGWVDAFVDPVDNSQGLDATLRVRGRNAFPSPHLFAAVTTFIDARPERPKFDDVLAGIMQPLHAFDAEQAAVIGIRGQAWSPERRIKPYREPLFVVRSKGGYGLNATILFEAYYPGTRQRVTDGFEDVYGALRSWGCAALEMISVASGHVRASICGSQKAHELGAAMAIHEAAGGVVFTWRDMAPASTDPASHVAALERRSLWDETYNFDAQYPVVFCASEEDAAQLCARLKVRMSA